MQRSDYRLSYGYDDEDQQLEGDLLSPEVDAREFNPDTCLHRVENRATPWNSTASLGHNEYANLLESLADRFGCGLEPQRALETPNHSSSPDMAHRRPTSVRNEYKRPRPDDTAPFSGLRNTSIDSETPSKGGTAPRLSDGFTAKPSATPTIVSTPRTEGLSRVCSNDYALSDPFTSKSELDGSLHLAPSCDSSIHLSLYGEIITLDLATMKPSPEVIVQLLKLARSDKLSYMLTGSYFRRSNRPEAAKIVVQAMIDELTSRGVPESSLKPAFLFLFACELDLAKAAIGAKQPRSVAANHTQSAKEWIQKVYGKGESINDNKETISSLVLQRGKTSTPHPTLPRQRSPTGPSHGELKILKREVQSLRDRNSHLSRQVDELKVQKRKLEESYQHERNVRRRHLARMKELEREKERLEEDVMRQTRQRLTRGDGSRVA